MSNPRPKKARVFIGSSVEGIQIAKALQLGLDYVAEVTLWSQGVFGLSQGTLEDIVRASKRFDFAVLVLTPDDLVEKRGAKGNSPRDNVIFELGFFMGALGRERTFLVYCRDEQLHLPSDLAGVTAATFARRSDNDLMGALGAACTLIEEAIRRVQADDQPSVRLLVRRNSTDELILVVEAQNDVPFECRHWYKLENNVIVSGIPHGWTTLIPTQDERRFRFKDKVTVPDGQNVVVSFSYRGLVDPGRPKPQKQKEINQLYGLGGGEPTLLREENPRS